MSSYLETYSEYNKPTVPKTGKNRAFFDFLREFRGKVLRLRLLGTPEISLAQASLTEALSSKAQAVLYYLAVTGQPQPRSALATLLWGDTPDDAARTNLRKALVQLRRSLGDYLDIDRHTVAFKSDSSPWVDVVEFETHLNENENKAEIS